MYEPENSCYYHAFRSLFLRLCQATIPEAYRMEGYYKTWMVEYAPHLEQYVSLVQAVHQQTAYGETIHAQGLGQEAG